MDTDALTAENLIHVHTRAMLIEDGDLVELDPELCREAGFKWPVAVTRAVFATVIDLTPAAKRAGNDVKGRTWDVLWMALNGMRRAGGGSSCLFKMAAVIKRVQPTTVILRVTCGPGDTMEPVLTILLPEED